MTRRFWTYLGNKTMNIKILILIILLAAASRFYQLTNFPGSLYWDELAIGYNAYSILKTGKDEYGKFLPLIFESFQDSKLPGYIYFTSLSELFFGITPFSVRLPSAVFGVGSVILLYFITYLLTKNNRISFFSSLLMAITPWSIQFSRAGFEANGALFFSLLAILFLIRWLNSKNKLIFFTLIAVFSIYFYYQQRIFFPLYTLITLLLFKKIKNSFKEIIISLLLSIILLMPIIINMITSSGRLSYVSIFSQQSVIDKEFNYKTIENTFTGKLIHNRYFAYSLIFFNSYFKHFSTEFLFTDGDPNPRHGVMGMGELYLWTLPLLFLGLISILKNKTAVKIIIPWILISPLSSALAIPSPHALRSLLLLPPLLIMTAFGLEYIILIIKNRKLLQIFNILTIALLFVFYFYYIHVYYNHEKERVLSWGAGYKELFEYTNREEKNYDNIYITGYYWRPYIFMLFYTGYSPSAHQVNPSNSHIGKYYFGSASYDSSNPRYEYSDRFFKDYSNKRNILLALSPSEVSSTDNIIHTIYVNNKPVFQLVKK